MYNVRSKHFEKNITKTGWVGVQMGARAIEELKENRFGKARENTDNRPAWRTPVS